MAFFTGKFDRKVDPKGRLSLPSKLVACGEEESLFYVLPGRQAFDGSYLFLALVPVATAEAALVEKAPSCASLDFDAPLDQFRNELQFLEKCEPVSVQGQGRFVLPEELRKRAHIEDEVVVLGATHSIYIWSASTYSSFLEGKS